MLSRLSLSSTADYHYKWKAL